MSRSGRQLQVVRQAVRLQQWRQDEQRAVFEAARAETEARRGTAQQHEAELHALHAAARGICEAGRSLQPALLGAARRHAARCAADVHAAQAEVEVAQQAEAAQHEALSDVAARRRGLERQAERLHDALEATRLAALYREQDEQHAARQTWQEGCDGSR
ncbi:hypothetical protein [Methylibium rhizosphaerae]|uniref:hypothetical protein n=1 Tax=Methylibium rhizosphaerae TaxID=2570323 RepID=UPI0011296570|nr:hypothetical protein [Methylibium rhizosphaerae]